MNRREFIRALSALPFIGIAAAVAKESTVVMDFPHKFVGYAAMMRHCNEELRAPLVEPKTFDGFAVRYSDIEPRYWLGPRKG